MAAAYLFNNRKLPAPLDWNKEAYPYAYMIAAYDYPYDEVTGEGSPYFDAELIVSSAPLYHKYSVVNIATKHRYLYTKNVCKSVKYGYDHQSYINGGSEFAWELRTEETETDANTYVYRSTLGGIYEPIWANVDLYEYEDSETLTLEGSEPIPVGGEPEQPEPTTAPADLYKIKNGVGQTHDAYKRVGDQWVPLDGYNG